MSAGVQQLQLVLCLAAAAVPRQCCLPSGRSPYIAGRERGPAQHEAPMPGPVLLLLRLPVTSADRTVGDDFVVWQLW